MTPVYFISYKFFFVVVKQNVPTSDHTRQFDVWYSCAADGGIKSVYISPAPQGNLYVYPFHRLSLNLYSDSVSLFIQISEYLFKF